MNKILLATMSLEIGGAETHIVELALDLKRRGFDVSVASNGGVYAADLERAGIPHFKAPMDRRSLRCMAKSYFIMRKLIRREKPDIVHAHARIPGFICGLIHRRVRFHFVTTAHWVFDVSGSLRRLTNWGQKTIAVSDDIKQYLMDNYGMPQKDIYVTINGVDTEKFSPDIAPDDIVSEFNLDPNRPVICNVSRLDESAAAATRVLLDIAPRLHERIPGVQLVITGGGDIFDELNEKACAVNALTSANTVTMTGARADVNRVLAACDLFVGVSRAALEAMAAQKPVIMAGKEGYAGLFTPDKAKMAMDTNYCFRGCELTSPEHLLRDIADFFENTDEAGRAELGKFGRDLVVGEYSVKKMTDDCIEVYEAVSRAQRNVVMSGYYGFRNAGDEAILQAIHRSITGSITGSCGEASITVLSYDPKDTKSRYGFNAVNRFSFFRVMKALRGCDALVLGGGSLLQDVTSTRSLLYYLFIVNAAKRKGKKVMLFANGIGPVRKPANRRRVRRAVERADVVTLRDPESAEELRAMGVTRDDIRVTADPVFTMSGIPRDDALQILEKCGVGPGPFVAVSIRDWPGMGGFEEKIARICDTICETAGRGIVFIPMQSDMEIGLCRRVQGMMKNPSHLLEGRYTTEELMGIIGVSDIVLAMRLHALVFAACMNVPFLGLVYDPKVSAFLSALSMPSAGDIENLDEASALSAVMSVLERRGELAGELERKSAAMRAAASEDPSLFLAMLRSGSR